jgi:hypothetical protein
MFCLIPFRHMSALPVVIVVLGHDRFLWQPSLVVPRPPRAMLDHTFLYFFLLRAIVVFSYICASFMWDCYILHHVCLHRGVWDPHIVFFNCNYFVFIWSIYFTNLGRIFTNLCGFVLACVIYLTWSMVPVETMRYLRMIFLKAIPIGMCPSELKKSLNSLVYHEANIMITIVYFSKNWKI